MAVVPTVSVIIPSYNRKDWLCETLDSLANQTLPHDQFEVIVVDDGSTDDTASITKATYPFALQYLWQSNQGDAAARNFGVAHSQAEILVFLDDDVLVEPDYLRYLVKYQQGVDNRIVTGTEILWLKETNPLAQPDNPLSVNSRKQTLVDLPFVDVCSNNMSVKREAYLQIGMMESLDFPGSSIWCDVDFSFRAYKQGFKFYRSFQAVCYHRDYVAMNLDNAKNRMYKVAYRSVSLFQKYPDLLAYLPMFEDKTPIDWKQDALKLIVRKLVRKIVSTNILLKCMESLADVLARTLPRSLLITPLHRWIIGGNIYHGYQEGLKDFGCVNHHQLKSR